MEMGKVALSVVLGMLALFVGNIEGQQGVGTPTPAPTVDLGSTTPVPTIQGIGDIPASVLGNNSLLIEWCSNSDTTANLPKFEDCQAEAEETKDLCHITDIIQSAWEETIKIRVHHRKAETLAKTVNRERVCSFYKDTPAPTSTTASSTTSSSPTTSSTPTQSITSMTTEPPATSTTTTQSPTADSSLNYLWWLIPIVVASSLVLCFLIAFILHRYTKRAGYASAKTPAAAGEAMKNEGSDV